MAGYAIEPARGDLGAVAAIYHDAGFRPDLVTDLELLRGLGGEVFLATRGGEVAGVSSCLPFGHTGWIGGVAVRPAHRRRGLGGELTAAALAALTAGGVGTALLHATAMARPLYERMGFRAEAEFVELHGPADRRPAVAPVHVRPGTPGDLPTVLDLDRVATGEDRERLLRALWPGGGWVYDDAGGVRGFALPQAPSAAGAVVSADPEAGEDLLAVALAGRTGVRVPLPASQKRAREFLERQGFREALRTTRMHLGPAPRWHADHLVSVFNLYWG